MINSRYMRVASALLLALGMSGCARFPAATDPEPASSDRETSTGEAPAGGSVDQSPATERDDADDPVATPIETGETAIERRRMMLAASEHSLEPDSVGYFMDVHQAKLLQALGDPFDIRRDGDAFHLRVPGNRIFSSNSERIAESLRVELRKLAGVLVEFDKTLVIVHGHTDSRGDAEYNHALSERRALHVAELLVEYGVLPERIVAVGHGEQEPLAGNETKDGRAANRRLEIVVEPLVRTGS